jgi:DNA mismatch repair protein MutS2
VREHLDGLEASLETLGGLDALAAIGDWGKTHGLTLTERDADEPLRIVSGHHPLLWIHQRERSVPLDLALAQGDRAVVISGPNAGGKTTALKTVGLMQLMTQAGLPVPADPATNIPVPRRVHADIGDDQDVMAGRSTFTAHMASIAAICEAADAGSLVLLDELGTATDPQEGGALAQSILEALSARGCLAIATSHLALLKGWAHETEGVQNASVGLDAETRRPTYRLSLGLPGPSEALIIAGQVGLAPEILSRARSLVPEQEQRLSALVADLRERERALGSLQDDAEKLRGRLHEAERRHRDAAAEAERERKEFRRGAAAERRRLLADAKAEVERRIAHLPAKRDLHDAKSAIEADIRSADAEIAEATWSPVEGGGDFAVGDAVEITDARETGQVVAIDEGRGEAQVETRHGMTVRVAVDRLRPAESGEPTRKGNISFAKRDDVTTELDLIGVRVGPALERLDKFLDEAASHGIERVRVIHGFGTGALRKAVREFADDHALVRRWSSSSPEAGGHAVTVIEIR